MERRRTDPEVQFVGSYSTPACLADSWEGCSPLQLCAYEPGVPSACLSGWWHRCTPPPDNWTALCPSGFLCDASAGPPPQRLCHTGHTWSSSPRCAPWGVLWAEWTLQTSIGIPQKCTGEHFPRGRDDGQPSGSCTWCCKYIVMTAKSFPSLTNYLKLQIVHLNFLSSVWTAWCCSRVYLWPKDLLHMRQVKRGWPWIFWCFLNVATESVRKSQPCDRQPNCGLSRDISKSDYQKNEDVK